MIRQYSCLISPTQLFYRDSIVSAWSHVRFCGLKIFSLNDTWPQDNQLPLALSSGNSDYSKDRGQPGHARPRKAVLCPCSAFGMMKIFPTHVFVCLCYTQFLNSGTSLKTIWNMVAFLGWFNPGLPFFILYIQYFSAEEWGEEEQRLQRDHQEWWTSGRK